MQPGGSMGQDVRIRLIGRFGIDVDGVAADAAPLGRLGKVAFGFLVAERHRSVSRDELADVIWGERLPLTWPHALRGVVSRMRAVLSAAGLSGPDALTSASGCYQLHLPLGATVDIEQAPTALDAARVEMAGGDVEAAVGAAREAVALTSGRFLAGSGGEWVERRQRAVDEIRLDALEVLSTAASLSGRAALAAEAAEEAIGLQPLRESAYVRLADAHDAAGNRAEALRAHERCRRILADELGVNPSPTTEAAYLRLLTADDPPAGRPDREPDRLPTSVTSFVGRGQAISDVRKCLRTTRLLSLVGVGGVGKSRLALQVAGEVAGDDAEGVWLVELAALGDPGLVARQVLSVLGAPEVRGESPAESVARHLGASRVLLVMDNCEHLVVACADLVDVLLRRCPGLRILTTSRESLGVPGEVTWPVPPLTAPDDRGGVGTTEGLLDYEAVRLFVDRAGAVAPDLRLDERTIVDVAAIAQRLEGIPLAIELAAAWAKILSVAEIARRLDDRFRLLVGGPRTAPARHQTLRAALDWSHESLTASEAAVLRRLSVFAGGFGLEAAETVCRAESVDDVDDVDVLGALSCLFDKSLVLVDRTGEGTRYRQLETVRQYAAERMVENSEEAECRRRHLAWATALAESAELGLQGSEQDRWLDALDADHDNLRAALDRAAQAGGTPELGARLACALWRFWEIRGWLSEGRSALSTWISRDGVPAPLRARLLNAAGILAQRQRDWVAARAWYEECLVVRRSLGEELGVASALHGLANVAYLEGDLDAASAGFQENLALARRVGVPSMVAASLLNLGVVQQTLFIRNRAPKEVAGPRAIAYLTESLGEYEQLGDRQGMALAFENLGTASAWLGEHEDAVHYQEQSLALRRQLGDKPGIATSARYLSRLVLRTGDCGAARGLSEECLAIERELGKPSDEAEALGFLAQVSMVERDWDEARSLLVESIALHRRRPDQPVPPWLLHGLGEVATAQRDFGAARSALEELAANARRLDQPALLGGALSRLSLVALAEGEMAEVGACATEALTDPRSRNSIWVLALLAEALAGAAVDAGDASVAARLLAASDALRRSFDPPAEQPFLPLEQVRTLAAARQALGDGAFGATWEIGAALSHEDLAELLDAVASGVSSRALPSS